MPPEVEIRQSSNRAIVIVRFMLRRSKLMQCLSQVRVYLKSAWLRCVGMVPREEKQTKSPLPESGAAEQEWLVRRQPRRAVRLRAQKYGQRSGSERTLRQKGKNERMG
jgi:hypothetical protein